MAETKTWTGGCHCGAVRYEVAANLEGIYTCNCSICSKSGTMLHFVPAASFRLLQGEDMLTRYQFHKPAAEPALTNEYSLVLYRATQEALTNIAKHARASRVEVSLQPRQHTVALSIRDDGVGFDDQALLARPRRRKDDPWKLGLLGLRERVELLGGTFGITTAPGKGTLIRVELPV